MLSERNSFICRGLTVVGCLRMMGLPYLSVISGRVEMRSLIHLSIPRILLLLTNICRICEGIIGGFDFLLNTFLYIPKFLQ